MGLFDSIWSSQGGSAGFGSGDPSNTDSSPASLFGASSSGSSAQSGIQGGVGLAGLGLEAYGTYEKTQAEKASTAASIQIAQLEQQVNDQRQLAMQINYRRQATQQIRDVQQKRALGLAAATGQGAQYGSGLQGAQAQATAEGAYNLEGLGANLMVGNAIFGLDRSISGQRIAQFQAQSRAASASGIMSLGGSLMQAAGSVAQLGMFAAAL